MRAVLAAALAAGLAGGCASTEGGLGGGGLSSLGGGAAAHRVKKRNTPVEAFEPVGFEALAAEGRSMRNRPVRVRALLSPTAPGRAALRDPEGRVATSIALDASNLEPDERDRLAACARACEAEVLAIVQAPLGTDGFYLEAFYLEGGPA